MSNSRFPSLKGREREFDIISLACRYIPDILALRIRNANENFPGRQDGNQLTFSVVVA
jgi:hypothetical protein